VLHAPLISSPLTWYILIILGEENKLLTHYHAIFSNLLIFHPSSAQILSPAPCSQIPSVFVLSLLTETTGKFFFPNGSTALSWALASYFSF
jgi:hypothetical protein